MEWVPATEFAAMVRWLGVGCRELGLEIPAFRSPPRRAGAARTIRGLGAEAVVAIRLRGRGVEDVAADMVEGTIVANRLPPERAEVARRLLRQAIEPGPGAPAPGPDGSRILGGHARVAERQTQAA